MYQSVFALRSLRFFALFGPTVLLACSSSTGEATRPKEGGAALAARQSMTSGGDVKSCEEESGDRTTPPSGCTALVRPELSRIPATHRAPLAFLGRNLERTSRVAGAAR